MAFGLDISAIGDLGGLGNIGDMVQAFTSQGKKSSGGGNAAAPPFDPELMLASKIKEFAVSDPTNDDDGMGLDTSLMKDALALDAMVTLSKLQNSAGPAATAPMDFTRMIQDAMAVAPENIRNAPASEAAIPMKAAGQTPVAENTPLLSDKALGTLSAMFESGDGPGVIGYDRVGGTSYGSFQIASNTGTFDRFVEFLKDQAPEWAEKLANAGRANTGSKSGAVPEIWKQIAGDSPELFENLQRQFIQNSHYAPAANKILSSMGLNMDSMPEALKEVLFSTSVQHGASGAARIFETALDHLSGQRKGLGFVKELIEQVYEIRKSDFPSSTDQVRKAVANRLLNEKDAALSMLSKGLDSVV